MAAGAGTRMHSDVPKVAHRLAGRAVVRHVVEAAREAGVGDIVVVVSAAPDASAVREAAGEGVTFAVQEKQLGTGHAVECARDAAGDAEYVLILNGDVPLILPSTLSLLMSETEATTADFAVLAAEVPVESYGVLELAGDRITRIIETKEIEGIDRADVRPINSGQYAARASWLWPRLERVAPAANGERYLTALAGIAHDEGNPALVVWADEAAEVRGINDRIQLAEAEASMRDRIRRRHMLAGVTFADPATAYVDAGVTIGRDTVIEAQTHIVGSSAIGERCVIGPGSHIRDSSVADNCIVRYSMIEASTLEGGVDVGPYSHVRPKSHLCEGVHLGNYAEVKGSRLGRGTKMGHFSYIGDAEVGEGVNIGAGTITANYDGASKHGTVIGDGAFIGSDTMLVAPVTIGRGARTSAGAVVNKDVPDGMIAIGAPARIRSLTDKQEDPDAGR
jgi:bifunctional UDP-N-acetylglucosamine pyrophosphorylase/glucosamine-1-phosphate N-acetyltransferase